MRSLSGLSVQVLALRNTFLRPSHSCKQKEIMSELNIREIAERIAAKPWKIIALLQGVRNLTAAREQQAAEIAGLRDALGLAKAQLSIGRRFLPSHGSFGEEGVSNYQSAQRAVDAALAAIPPAPCDIAHISPVPSKECEEKVSTSTIPIES